MIILSPYKKMLG